MLIICKVEKCISGTHIYSLVGTQDLSLWQPLNSQMLLDMYNQVQKHNVKSASQMVSNIWEFALYTYDKAIDWGDKGCTIMARNLNFLHVLIIIRFREGSSQ